MEILYGPKNGLNAFGYNSAESEPILRQFEREPKFCLFLVMRIAHDFSDFPSNKFYDI